MRVSKGADDVLGLEIAVHDAAIVRGDKRAADLERGGYGPARRHRAAGELFAKRLTLEVFGRDEHLVVDLFERVDGGDRRMRQCRGGPRFLPEPRSIRSSRNKCGGSALSATARCSRVSSAR